MLKHRKLLILASLLIAIAAGAFILYHRSTQSPEPARLLPEGDLILYANLKPAHLFDLGKSGTVQLEGEYKDFVDKTGIQFERDLDEVAMSRRDTADGRDVESSEVFVGKFDQTRIGFGYVDDCLILGLNYITNYTYSGNVQANHTIMLQLNLRTLGGTSVSQGVGRPTSN